MPVPYEVVPSPSYPTPDYSAFGKMLGDLPTVYQQSRQRQNQLAEQKNQLALQQVQIDTINALKNDPGSYTNPDGTINYQKLTQLFAKQGNVDELNALIPNINTQVYQQQAQKLASDLFGGGSSAAQPAGGSPPVSVSGEPLDIGAGGGYAGAIRPGVVPPDNSAFQDRIQDLQQDAEDAGIPNVMTSGERSYAEQAELRRRYESGQGGVAARPGESLHERGLAADVVATTPSQQPQLIAMSQEPWRGLDNLARINDPVHFQPAPGTIAAQQRAAGFPPSAAASATNPPMSAQPAARPVGSQPSPQGPFGSMVANDVSGFLPVPTPPQTPQAKLAAAMGAQQGNPAVQPPQPQQPPSRPIKRMPPFVAGTNSAEGSIAKLDSIIAKAAMNPTPMAQNLAKLAEARKQEFIDAITPVSVTPQSTIIDPQTGKPLYQGSAGASRLTSNAIDNAAENLLKTGKMPTNLGRGAQGAAEVSAIMNRAAELATARGIDPETLPSLQQAFGARSQGLKSVFQRAPNLSLVENEANRLIPRVRDLLPKLDHTKYPTINAAINAYEKATGDPNIVKFGISTESLANVYARVLKGGATPTGGETEEAHKLLDKAWSEGQINAALDQMSLELQSAKQSTDDTLKDYGLSMGDIQGGSSPPPPKNQSPPASGGFTPPPGWSVKVSP